jgi:hypothetical protein
MEVERDAAGARDGVLYNRKEQNTDLPYFLIPVAIMCVQLHTYRQELSIKDFFFIPTHFDY